MVTKAFMTRAFHAAMFVMTVVMRCVEAAGGRERVLLASAEIAKSAGTHDWLNIAWVLGNLAFEIARRSFKGRWI